MLGPEKIWTEEWYGIVTGYWRKLHCEELARVHFASNVVVE
jgi:hypothetical protein